MTEWHRAGTGNMRIDAHAAAPVGLAMVDRHLRFVDVNQALAALDGIGAAGQVGRHIRDVLPSGLADEAIPVADADPDAVIGVGAVVEDITEHRAAERRTAQQQQMLVIDDIEAEPYLRAVNPQFAAFVKRSRLQALCVVPPAVDNAVLGAVVVGRDRPTGGFDALDQALMAQVADWATLAMLNARLAEDARASQARFSRAFVNAPVGAALSIRNRLAAR